MIARIGHRGARGHAPENTLAGIEAGLSFGVEFVEIDLQRTRDGHLVLLHDSTVDRTTDGHGAIAEMTLAQVRVLRGADGAPVPLLADALRAVSGRAGVMVELKAGDTARQAVEGVHAARFQGPVIYASFLHDELLAVRRADQRAQTLALLEGVPVNRTAFATDAQATHVGLAFESATPSFVRALQHDKFAVFVYTVNDPADIRAAQELGVDGIISDYPDRLR